MEWNIFFTFAKTYGLPYALMVAVAIAYWFEVRDRNKNTVSIDLYKDQSEHCDEVHAVLSNHTASLEKLVELVRILSNRGGN